MSLQQSIQNDSLSALKKGQSNVVSALRLLLAALKNDQIAKQRELADEDVYAIIRKLIKERHESIDLYQKAGRNGEVEKDQHEIKILSAYLPKDLSDEDIKALIHRVIEKTKAESMADFGKVMKAVMAEVKGQASGQRVSDEVKQTLQKP